MKDKKIAVVSSGVVSSGVVDHEESFIDGNIMVPNVDINFSEDANAGLEEADKSAFAIPFIKLLQGLSPELKDVDGARPGLFINTITNEIFKEIEVIPCAFQRVFIRWGARSSGGGFKGQFSSVDIELKKIDYTTNEDGFYKIGDDDLVDTRNHFILYKASDDVWRPALISMSATQIRKSKRWMTLIQGVEMRTQEGKIFTPPSFSHSYIMRSVEERNAKGAWNSFQASLHTQVSDAEVYAKAKNFYKSVMACEVEVLQPTPDFHDTSEENKF